MDILEISTLFIIFLCILGLSWFAGSDAPYVPTKMEKIKKVLKNAGVKKGAIFYELGSGDGRVVLEAAKLGALAHGVEQSWIRVWYSRFLTKKMSLSDCYFYHGDIFSRHYYPADVVYIYLLQKAVNKLEKKLPHEIKKGAVIITQTYHFRNLKPFKKADNFWFYRV